MKQSFKRTNANSGKVIAVTLILLFVGINFFKSENEAGPQEKQFAKAHQEKVQDRKFDNNLAKPQNIKNLKFAYTGNWEKNDLTKSSQDQKFSFATPENTRGQIQPTSAKKIADDKKKKKIAKKTKTTKKFAKKYKKRNGFENSDYEIDDSTSYPRTAYFTKPAQQERTPSDEEKEKKLTAKEWLEKIIQSNSTAEFVAKFKSGSEVSQGLFYSVVETLLSSEQGSTKKLGFEALGQTPSPISLTKYALHINDEMSGELKTYAQSTLEIYEQPIYLRTLNPSLNSPNSDVRILAATMIKNITTTIFQTQSKAGENVVYTAAQIASFKIMLNQSLIVINSAIRDGLEGDVLASFTSAQIILSQFLG